MVTPSQAHWDQAWEGRDPATTSWFQSHSQRSLALVTRSGVRPDDPIVDVGCGVSALINDLLDAGFVDLTALDISQPALDTLLAALRERGSEHLVQRVCADVVNWRPDRTYSLWHDRAVNHFLTEPDQRHAYATTAGAAVRPGGHLILAAFTPDGPDMCSGLPVFRAEPADLAAEFATWFELRSVEHETHTTPWLAAQRFHYLLFVRR